MDIQEKVNSLTRLPMFQLSLSSKELFHSNFIYWVISSYKKECSKLFSKYLSNKGNSEIIDVIREDKKRDVVIYFQDEAGEKSTLVLENKVKSLPNYEQLRDYTTTDLTENYLLLSLTKPDFISPNNKIIICDLKREWDYINYNDFSIMLEQILFEIELKNPYHSLIIKDYIQFARLLNELTEEIYRITISGKYDFYQESNEWITLLKNIRMHDFYLKLNHEVLAIELHKRIQNEVSDLFLVPRKSWKKASSQEVFTSSGFTRGSGITEVKYVIGQKNNWPVIAGIQIQGIQFRLFIESKKGFAKKIAYKLLENNLWFDFSYLKETILLDGKEYPEKSGKDFNSYSGEFFYKSVKLKECDSEELIDEILKYLKYIHMEKENLMRKINEIHF